MSPSREIAAGTRCATDSSRLLAVNCSSPSRVESRTLLRTGSVLLVGTTRPTTVRPSARFSCKHSSFIVVWSLPCGGTSYPTPRATYCSSAGRGSILCYLARVPEAATVAVIFGRGKLPHGWPNRSEVRPTRASVCPRSGAHQLATPVDELRRPPRRACRPGGTVRPGAAGHSDRYGRGRQDPSGSGARRDDSGALRGMDVVG